MDRFMSLRVRLLTSTSLALTIFISHESLAGDEAVLIKTREIPEVIRPAEEIDTAIIMLPTDSLLDLSGIGIEPETNTYDLFIPRVEVESGDQGLILLPSTIATENRASRLIDIFKMYEDDYVTVDIPLTSVHWGADPGVNYNNVNYGLGISLVRPLNSKRDGEITFSTSVFKDSFSEFAWIGSTTYSEPATNFFDLPGLDRVRVGGTLAASYKGIEFNAPSRFIAAPLLYAKIDLTDTISIAMDGLPNDGNTVKVGFIGVKAQYKLGGEKPPP